MRRPEYVPEHSVFIASHAADQGPRLGPALVALVALALVAALIGLALWLILGMAPPAIDVDPGHGVATIVQPCPNGGAAC